MNRFLSLFFLITVSQVSTASFAQTLDNPGTYMTAISNAQSEMNQKYMAYMSAAAHGHRARKVDKLRTQALESIDNSRYKTIELPIYKGDNSLRQSSINYIKLCYNVFNEDYAKIVNMEDIAEQSFDEMQAYILLQEKTNEKIKEAVAGMDSSTKTFAAKYNVQLIEGKNELDEKLTDAGKVNHYLNDVYLVFFKCNWQDGEIIKAMNTGKLTEVEQGRTSLLRYANEGMLALDTMKNFSGDPSLANTCRKVLQSYKKIAEEDLPKQTDFYLKQENFNKIKKAYEAKSDDAHTKQDVAAYNKSVKDINNASGTYNQVNTSLNQQRHSITESWNDAEKTFSDAHMPYYK